ncbi:MAG: hypothetical protein ACLFWL_11980 [Candidatus Brocadiia bacterium]
MGFIIRMKFWLGLGLMVIVALLILVFGALPQVGENREQYEDLKDRSEKMDRLVRGEIPNPKWVKQQEGVQKKLERQLTGIEEFLKAPDSQLEKHLGGGSKLLPYFIFREKYREKREEIEQRLRNSVEKVISKNPLGFSQRGLGLTSPPKEELLPLEKKLWIREDLVEAIESLNKDGDIVTVFRELKFTAKPERYLARVHKNQFNVIPFEMTVAMEFDFVPIFVQKILQIDVQPEITSIAMTRYRHKVKMSETGEGEDRREPEEREEPTYRGGGRPGAFGGRRPMEEMEETMTAPSTGETEEVTEKWLVELTITGYVPDYKQEKAEKDKRTGSNAS